MLLLKFSVKAALGRSLATLARISGPYQGTELGGSGCRPAAIGTARPKTAGCSRPCWGVGKEPAKSSFGLQCAFLGRACLEG